MPTVMESGAAQQYDVSSWQGIVVPAGTPKPIVQRLHRDLVKVLGATDVKEKFAQYGAEAVASTPEQFGAFIRQEIGRWQKVAQYSGVKPE